MTSEPYRIALETALAEITEITATLQQLTVRKGQVETLIAALQPVFGETMTTNDAFSPHQAPVTTVQDGVAPNENAQEPETPEYSYLQVPAPLPDSDGSPFERRVKASFRFKGLAAQR